jgi:serine/threonine protein kinase
VSVYAAILRKYLSSAYFFKDKRMPSVVLRNLGLRHTARVQQILAKHKLANVHSPWRSGGFSDVYELGDNKLLRLSSVQALSKQYIDALAKNAVAVAERARDLMPKFDTFMVYYLGVVGKVHQAIFESVVERLTPIPFEEWLDNYDSPKQLMHALLTFGQTMVERGILHRDMSLGNILLCKPDPTESKRFMFIDADDACLLPDGLTCNDGLQISTTGFVLPELELRRNRVVAHKQIEIGRRFGRSLAYDGTPAYRRSSDLILHNMVHGIITVGLAAIVRVRKANMMYLRFDDFAFDDGWQRFISRANTLTIAERMDFPTALQVLDALSDDAGLVPAAIPGPASDASMATSSRRTTSVKRADSRLVKSRRSTSTGSGIVKSRRTTSVKRTGSRLVKSRRSTSASNTHSSGM